MHITIATPSLEEPTGNARTARRWQTLLRELGHEVGVVRSSESDEPGTANAIECDLLIAIHARRSAREVRAFHDAHPDRPIIVLLSGTDLYQDLPENSAAQQSLELADRVIVLHPAAITDVPEPYRSRVRWIPQSSQPPTNLGPRPTDRFLVVVASNLREVKDPLRTRDATLLLPDSSRIEVEHFGLALDPAIEEEIASRPAPRYRYIGPLPPEEALRRIGSAHILSITSKLEGGANVVSESIVVGTPVVSSRIAGSIGLLGADYPGYFPVGDTVALAEVLTRSESDPEFYRDLQTHIHARAGLFTPATETQRWRELLDDLDGKSPPEPGS